MRQLFGDPSLAIVLKSTLLLPKAISRNITSVNRELLFSGSIEK
jgi:hypothetical protein